MAFQALLTEKVAEREYRTVLTTRELEELPEGELLIRVSFSSLNYKDALSAAGNPGVTRQFPHTPGIDAAGVVEHSTAEHWSAGDPVLVTGYDLGMDTDGGLAEYIRVPAQWAIRLPAGLSARDAMVLGTAGLTAGLCLDKLTRMGAAPEHGPVLVTGATGGVGVIAVALLAKLGFEVHALTGKLEQAALLQQLGVSEVVGRDVFDDLGKRPLGKPRWHYAIDCVGGELLANLLKCIAPSGSVACCGLAGGADLPASVFPFILRDVNLLGVDSVEIPLARKQYIWRQFATDWQLPQLENIVSCLTLEQVPEVLSAFLTGNHVGRYLVAVAGENNTGY